MTAPSAEESRPALAGLITPPWLWVWLIYLLASLPAVISPPHAGAVTFGHLPVPPPQPVSTSAATLQHLSRIFLGLLSAMATVGAVGVAFPQLRGRWVEWRFRLTDDDRPVITEMQRFVDSHDPSVRLRVSLQASQMARLYPVGWRSARIAVFRPLAALWRRDREAAQAILLHEVAHRRQGDQLITGLGSPFVWLIRICVPAYVLLVLIPAAAYLADGGALASLHASLGVSVAGMIPNSIFLPVAALWLAELNADQQAAQAAGADALRRALRATAGPRAPLPAQAIALLSHPPRRLRLRRAAARPAGTLALIAAWPAATVVFCLVLPFVADAPLYATSLQRSLWGIVFRYTLRGVAVAGTPLIVATAAVLLAWPALAPGWQRLWSSGPRPGRQPWWPCLATATVPAGMLLLSLAPLQPSTQEIAQALQPQVSQGTCPKNTGWWVAGGLNRYNVSAEYEDLTLAGSKGDKRAMAADKRRLDATIRAALANPPPGAARPVYVQAMTGYRTAAQQFVGGNIVLATHTMVDATSLYVEAATQLTHTPDSHQGLDACLRKYFPKQYAGTARQDQQIAKDLQRQMQAIERP